MTENERRAIIRDTLNEVVRAIIDANFVWNHGEDVAAVTNTLIRALSNRAENLDAEIERDEPDGEVA